MLFTGLPVSITGVGSIQDRTVPSASPVIRCPAPSQASEVTGCGWGSSSVSRQPDTCHTCTSPSLLPAARPAPSGLNATALTQSVAPVSGGPADRGRPPPPTRHSHTFLSCDPAESRPPSGLNATEYTGPAGPSSGEPSAAGRAGSRTSHTPTRPAVLPAASIAPSGLNATACTFPPGPVRVASGAGRGG